MDFPREADTAIESNAFPGIQRLEWDDEHLAERDDLPALALDERGMILDCNKPLELLFGCDWRDLVWHHITWLFPQLPVDDLVLAGEVNPLLDYFILCSQPFQAQKQNGATFSSNLIFFRLEDNGEYFLRLIVFPSASEES